MGKWLAVSEKHLLVFLHLREMHFCGLVHNLCSCTTDKVDKRPFIVRVPSLLSLGLRFAIYGPESRLRKVGYGPEA